MKTVHGFFYCEELNLVDESGLLQYLAEKINVGLMCIYCENKGTKDFKTPEAVKKHMIDKGHCFMNTE
jgi:pre-60S factor REI1